MTIEVSAIDKNGQRWTLTMPNDDKDKGLEARMIGFLKQHMAENRVL